MQTTALTHLLRSHTAPAGALLPFIPRTAPALLASLLMAGTSATGEMIDNAMKEIVREAETFSSHLYVGTNHEGSLKIAEGGSYTDIGTSDAYFGYYPGSRGTLLVTGASSIFSSNGNVFLGVEGHGEMTIADGGAVTVGGTVILGRYADARGEVLVTGSDSTLKSKEIIVGSGGSGQITIADGGVVEATKVKVSNDNSTGDIFVEGNDSLLAVSELQVGHTGTGRLHIFDGAAVQTDSFYLGHTADSYGELLITGSGPRLRLPWPPFHRHIAHPLLAGN